MMKMPFAHCMNPILYGLSTIIVYVTATTATHAEGKPDTLELIAKGVVEDAGLSYSLYDIHADVRFAQEHDLVLILRNSGAKYIHTDLSADGIHLTDSDGKRVGVQVSKSPQGLANGQLGVFHLHFNAQDAPPPWDIIVEGGKDKIVPYTLRFKVAKLPLNK